MKRDSVRNAASVSTLTIAANVWIQSFTASSEPSALSGRCQGTEEREKLRWVRGKHGDATMGGDVRERISQYQEIRWRSPLQPFIEKRGQSLQMILFFFR
jgi:hypothetical protein